MGVIPDAAVEAGYAAMNYLAIGRDEIRAILEAAAPHMLAGAWAAGAKVGFSVSREGFNGECAYEHCADSDYPPTNPHDGQPWTVGEYK